MIAILPFNNNVHGFIHEPVCFQRSAVSSQLVLTYFHLNAETISCNCVATVIPLICNV